jgi:hypothetical protein
MYRSGTIDKKTMREFDALAPRRMRYLSAAGSGKRTDEKSKSKRRKWRDPDDAPQITQEWVDRADLYQGKKLVRRGVAQTS